jgi:hypothetical protein
MSGPAIWNRFRRWVIAKLTERDERHGIELTMFIEAARLDTAELWPKLHAALDLIAEYAPTWLRRMRKIKNSIHVRRIPGTRARLVAGQFTLLDPYLLVNFQPAEIAASIIHEATHALLHSYGFTYNPEAPAREERACRASEVRFGRQLLRANVEGAQKVLDRAESLLKAPDEHVGVVIDADELRAIGIITRINELPVPHWFKRLLARRQGVLNTAVGRQAFGE